MVKEKQKPKYKSLSKGIDKTEQRNHIKKCFAFRVRKCNINVF